VFKLVCTEWRGCIRKKSSSWLYLTDSHCMDLATISSQLLPPPNYRYWTDCKLFLVNTFTCARSLSLRIYCMYVKCTCQWHQHCIMALWCAERSLISGYIGFGVHTFQTLDPPLELKTDCYSILLARSSRLRSTHASFPFCSTWVADTPACSPNAVCFCTACAVVRAWSSV
jgi:hypothetical protein